MANYNRIILIGNLTRDPQLSYLPNQTAAVDFGLAVNHRYRDAQGNNKDDVCYVDCRVYGKPAETANQYLAKGKQVYESTCAACHAAGVANAPKLGDKERWAPLIAEGMDKMVQIAIQGKGAMPPKGGRVDLPDEDIRATVAYMVSQSQ